MPFSAVAVPADVVSDLLERDDAGHPPELLVDREGGSPLRCCLRPSRPGERLALVSYAPLRRWAADPGPYDETGPVFVHADPCDGWTGSGWPGELGGPRVLRAYSARGRILGGAHVAEGDDPVAAVEALLADDRVAVVHARAVVFGCFTFALERS